MQECVWRISNEGNLLGRPDSRHPSSSGAQTPSEEGLAELHRWQYMVHLSCSLYKVSVYLYVCMYVCVYVCVCVFVRITKSYNKATLLQAPPAKERVYGGGAGKTHHVNIINPWRKWTDGRRCPVKELRSGGPEIRELRYSTDG